MKYDYPYLNIQMKVLKNLVYRREHCGYYEPCSKADIFILAEVSTAAFRWFMRMDLNILCYDVFGTAIQNNTHNTTEFDRNTDHHRDCANSAPKTMNGYFSLKLLPFGLIPLSLIDYSFNKALRPWLNLHIWLLLMRRWFSQSSKIAKQYPFIDSSKIRYVFKLKICWKRSRYDAACIQSVELPWKQWLTTAKKSAAVKAVPGKP